MISLPKDSSGLWYSGSSLQESSRRANLPRSCANTEGSAISRSSTSISSAREKISTMPCYKSTCRTPSRHNSMRLVPANKSCVNYPSSVVQKWRSGHHMMKGTWWSSFVMDSRPVPSIWRCWSVRWARCCPPLYCMPLLATRWIQMGTSL